MANGISQLIATQSQRTAPASPIQQLSAMESLKSRKMANEQSLQSKQLQGLKFAANIKSQLDSVENPLEKSKLYSTAIDLAERSGFDTSNYPKQYDEQAQRLLDVSHMQVYNPEQFSRQLKSKGFGFGSQIEFKDDEGNMFFGTTVQDRASGIVRPTIVAADGSDKQPVGQLQMVSGAGMTPQEKVTQAKDIATVKAEVRRDMEPEIQAKITKAKETVKAEVSKKLKQEGEKNRLSDLETIYTVLEKGDLNSIFGKGESIYPTLLRSQKGIDLMAKKDQFVAMLELAAAGQMKGAGQISDSERRILRDSATILNKPDISATAAMETMETTMELLRKKAGVKAKRQFKEGQTATNPDTGEKVIFTGGKWQTQ